MKFISKLLDMFCYGKLSFPDPHLHISDLYQKMYNHFISKYLKNKNTNNGGYTFLKFRKCPNFQILRYENNIFLGCSHIFFYFGDKYGVPGSRFGCIPGRSKNVPNSIAIDQESLISHFGIIKRPKTP